MTVGRRWFDQGEQIQIIYACWMLGSGVALEGIFAEEAVVMVKETEAPVPVVLPKGKIPRRPWLISNQYGLKFVLSQDNEVIFGGEAFARLGDDLMQMMVLAVNIHQPKGG